MKRAWLIGVTIVALGSGAILNAQAGRSADVRMKAAQQKADVEGDLKGAIEEYKKIVAGAGANRALAAQALVRMAECYQKLGDAEARKIFEQVAREYADQKESAKTARARLGVTTAARNTGTTTRQVWTGPAVDTYGSVSPDGRFISFTDWETGDLALHDLTTGQNRRLTNKNNWSDPAFAFGSAISRDGRQIAYGWLLISPTVPAIDHFGEVRIVGVDGRGLRVLVTNKNLEGVYVHDWSPDGRWLAVAFRRADRTVQIALVSTTDGAVRSLKSLDDRGINRMAFSSDGRYLAYDGAANAGSERRDIHVMAIDGSGDTPVVAHPANDRLLAWTADGNHLLFASDRSGVSGIWVQSVRDGKPQGEPELIRANIDPNPLGLTRSGALYYAAADAGSHIYVASADFETGRVLSPPAIIPKPYFGLIDYPEWSPDGKLLAYLSRGDANSRGTQMTTLVIRSMESGIGRELRSDLPYLNAQNTRPIWMPDGRFLLVTAVDRDGRRGVFRIDAQNGATVPLVLADPGRETVKVRAVSGDGRTLFLGRTDLKSDEEALIARDIASGQERVLARRKGGWGRATDLSPDGRTIALPARDANGSTTLWLVPVDGGEPRGLLHASPPEMIVGTMAKWSPDGKSLLIAIEKGNGSPSTLWRVSAVDGSTHQINLDANWASFLGVAGRHSTSFHPDGRQVAFVMGKSQLEIWALENFLPTFGAKK